MAYNADTHKKCCTCKEVKEFGEFQLRVKTGTLLKSQCVLCGRAYSIKYNKLNRVCEEYRNKNKERSLKYYYKNREEVLKKNKIHRDKNKKEISERRKLWHLKMDDSSRLMKAIYKKSWDQEMVKTQLFLAFINTQKEMNK